MKKLFLYFNFLLILFFSIYLSIYYNDDKHLQSQGTLITQTIDDDLVLLSEYKEKDIVYNNEIPHSYEFISNAIIKKYELPYFSSSIKTGDIYLKNEIVENFKIPYNLRVIKIQGNIILVENLENTIVNFSFLPKFKIKSNSNFTFSINHLGEKIDIEEYEVKFNKESGLYDFTIKIINNGIILDSATIRIDFSYYEKQEGLFIDKLYLYHDYVGNYVCKLINIRGVNYYKKVYLNIQDEFDNYYKISGEINGNNVIIKLK